MKDFSINEMQEMQKQLQEKYKDKWEPICADTGQNKLLWMIGEVILGVWCSFASLISPAWLAVAFINIAGLIYQYDYSMDEGTAGIFGVIFLILWVIFALLPNIIFPRQIYSINKKYMRISIAVNLVLFIVGTAMLVL